MKKNLNDIIFKTEGTCIDGYECHGEIHKVKGNAQKIIDDLFYIGKTATSKGEESEEDKYVKFSEGFNLDFEPNYAQITVSDIANLMINGGETDSYSYRTISISEPITVEELTELLNELYLIWWLGEDFPSYRLEGLNS